MKKQKNITIKESLLWAKNELDHDLDENRRLSKSSRGKYNCQFCKNLEKSSLWKEWLNKGINPLDEVLKK